MHTYNYLLHIAKRNKIDIKQLLKNNNNNSNTRKQPKSSSKQTNNSKQHHFSINTNNNNNNPFTMTGCFNNSTQHQQFKQNVSPYQPGKNSINISHYDDTTNKVGDDEYNSLLQLKNKQLNNNANEQQYNEAMMYGNNFSLGNGISSDRSKEHQQQHQPYQNGNEATTYNDPRLSYTMYRLGLDSLTHILEGHNITFNDLLFLTKEDLTDMNFHIYQKNRILNFIEEFQKKSKGYSEEEIENFFNMNPKYNSLIVNNSNIINLKE